MAQKKAHEVDGWARRPDWSHRIILVYGPDRGRVSEVAGMIAAASGVPLDDPFSTIKLDADTIEKEPGRLVDEARTVPMFSQARLVWIRGAANQKPLIDDLRDLIATPPSDAFIVVEAGELKKGAGLRSLVEGGGGAMALPCYADDNRGIDGLIDQEMTTAGLTIDLEARRVLKARLGGDRLASRGEIGKLVLYAHGMGKVTAADVVASTGDVSGDSIDLAVDSVMTGRLAAFDAAFARLSAEANRIPQLLAAAMRQFQQLQMLGAVMESDRKSAAAAIAGARPPVFFSRRATVEAALQVWKGKDCAMALERLNDVMLQTRRQPALAVPATRQALLGLAVRAARGGRTRS